jgi:hypothetical protein
LHLLYPQRHKPAAAREVGRGRAAEEEGAPVGGDAAWRGGAALRRRDAVEGAWCCGGASRRRGAAVGARAYSGTTRGRGCCGAARRRGWRLSATTTG